MALVLQPYSKDDFNQIPTLHAARTSWASRDILKFVNNTFKPLVLKHSLETVFGIGMLHRHFNLEGSEMLVEFKDTSTPWEATTLAADSNFLKGEIIPQGWTIAKDGALMPYEFQFFAVNAAAPRTDFDDPQIATFVREFVDLAREHGVAKDVALRRFPHKDFAGQLEITQGRANINLSPGQFDADDAELGKHAIQVMWFFEQGYETLKAKCECTDYWNGNGHECCGYWSYGQKPDECQV